jgi:2-polyprenyl-3-methyl-5-hydroxy-6-metoxy-1,4-benzoquinol methylase
VRHEKCPLCGGVQLLPVPPRSRRQRKLEPDICMGCGFVMLQQDALAGDRDEGDARCLHCPFGAQTDHLVPRSLVNSNRHLTALGALLRPGIRLLDVGCGEGALLAGAASRGVRATGLDLSERNCAVARSLSQATVICSSFEEAVFDEQFDVIMRSSMPWTRWHGCAACAPC